MNIHTNSRYTLKHFPSDLLPTRRTYNAYPPVDDVSIAQDVGCD
jgi:hypothetical protein